MNPLDSLDLAPWWRVVLYGIEFVWCLILAGLAWMWVKSEREGDGG